MIHQNWPHSAMMAQQLNLLVVDWGNLLQRGGG